MLINTVLLSLIVFVRYLCFAGGLYYLCYVLKKSAWQQKKISTSAPNPKIMKYEFKYSVISSVIFGFMGAWMYDMWEKGKTLVYMDFSKYGFLYAVFSLVVMMLIHDTYFYWTHRLLHVPWFYRRMHRVHHASLNPSPWAAFCFHPIEAVIESLYMPIIAFTVPSHPAVVVVFLMLMTVLGVINHLGYELYPDWILKRPFFREMISATNHSAHHRYNRFNYGLYFTLWDRIMNTLYEPSNQTILGETVGIDRDSKLHHLGGFTPIPEDRNSLQA